MRVLFVCHRVPFPPKRGGKIRPFNIIKHLTAQGHEVTVASLARSIDEREQASGLRDHAAKVLVEVIPETLAWARMVGRLPTMTPSSFGYFHSPALARRIAAEAAAVKHDLIFVHCSSVAPYVASLQGPVKIFDYGDVDSQKWREYSAYRPFPLSMGYWLEAVKLERTERLLGKNFDLCTGTTKAELATLRDLGITVPTDWFPNGVDTEFFKPAATEYDKDLVAFVGRMDYFPNQQAVTGFCRDILPLLRRQRPAVRFQIVGADPPPAIRDLGKLPGVSVTGSVPDVRSYVTKAALTVAPLEIARGTQNKILESMAMGVPVVCSMQAAGGVDAVPGEHLLTARAAQEHADAILRILESPELRGRLAQAGRTRVITNHSWDSSMRRLDTLIEGAFASRAAAR